MDNLPGTVIRQFCYPEDYMAVIELWQNAGPGIHLRRSDERKEILKRKYKIISFKSNNTMGDFIFFD